MLRRLAGRASPGGCRRGGGSTPPQPGTARTRAPASTAPCRTTQRPRLPAVPLGRHRKPMRLRPVSPPPAPPATPPTAHCRVCRPCRSSRRPQADERTHAPPLSGRREEAAAFGSRHRDRHSRRWARCERRRPHRHQRRRRLPAARERWRRTRSGSRSSSCDPRLERLRTWQGRARDVPAVPLTALHGIRPGWR